tara:strand:+ start:617 stop:1066 length:450 start_codon:yes stop_codon:yes gene_type:complete
LNYLLSLKKKYLILAILLIVVISLFIFTIKTIETSDSKKNLINLKENISDITNPKFTINSEKEKISISANEGNFLNSNEILLKNDVIFKSNKFTIYTDDVIFNRNNQTAASNNKSKFISNNTQIQSYGFEILDDGNKINFKGKTVIKLK